MADDPSDARIARRDNETRPYSPDEERAARYLTEITNAGGGDDPVGFLIASHRALVGMVVRLREVLRASGSNPDAIDPWETTH